LGRSFGVVAVVVDVVWIGGWGDVVDVVGCGVVAEVDWSGGCGDVVVDVGIDVCYDGCDGVLVDVDLVVF